MGTGGKVRPGCDADHSPPSSVEVKNELEVYFLSPHVPPWNEVGQLLKDWIKIIAGNKAFYNLQMMNLPQK
jgi:hypothetical protein